MELSRAFGSSTSNANYLLGGTAAVEAPESDDKVDDDDDDNSNSNKVKDVRGKIRVDYDSSSSPGGGIQVDAAAFTSELRSEVNRLREELRQVRDAKEQKAVQ